MKMIVGPRRQIVLSAIKLSFDSVNASHNSLANKKA
jgi:hypothetical protein